MLGAGGVVAERWLGDRRGRRLALGVAIAVSAVVAAVLTLPLVPAKTCTRRPISDVNEDAIETIGWPVFTATVARVWNDLPPAERANAVVYASNYGEAGAIARYGPALGIPRAYSGHNAFWRFGRPPDGARPVIVLGYRNPPGSAAASAAAGSRPGSTTAWTSTTRNKALPSGSAGNGRAVVETLAEAALAGPLTCVSAWVDGPTRSADVVIRPATLEPGRHSGREPLALPGQTEGGAGG